MGVGGKPSPYLSMRNQGAWDDRKLMKGLDPKGTRQESLEPTPQTLVPLKVRERPWEPR